MKKVLQSLGFLVGCACVAGAQTINPSSAPLLSAPAPAATSAAEVFARELTQQLIAKQYDAVSSHFDEKVTAAMPAAKLNEVWTGVLSQLGQFQSIQGTTVQQMQGLSIVLVTTKFENATVNLRWALDGKNRVAGFFIQPAGNAAPGSQSEAWSTPDYAKPASFHEEPATIGQSPWALTGTLTLPNGHGPFPAVVLVAGSGPEDQDETILTNKPFKDIAWGLASRGIAVLRYNKRTYQYAQEIKASEGNFTVNEETVIDARLAVDQLAKRPDISAVYVVGHSLGGMLAPRIAQGDSHVAGLILLAGSTRPLEQVIVEQIKYLAGLNGAVTPEGQKQIDSVEQSAKQIESPTLAADTKLDILGSPVPGSYFLDLRDYHPAQVAASLHIPMLILRGDRDYQVTLDDFDQWKKALAGRSNVTFKSYPGLYHLFMPSTSPGAGMGTPDDYQKSSHVVEPVIDEMASWIAAQTSAKVPTPAK
jgi:dienelactone hydrolase